MSEDYEGLLEEVDGCLEDEQNPRTKIEFFILIEESLSSMFDLPFMLSRTQKSQRKYARRIFKESVLPKFQKGMDGCLNEIYEIFDDMETSKGQDFISFYLSLLENGKYKEASNLALELLREVRSVKANYI